MAWIPVDNVHCQAVGAQINPQTPANIWFRVIAFDLAADPQLVAFIKIDGALSTAQARFFVYVRV